jgi:hypothetical protein
MNLRQLHEDKLKQVTVIGRVLDGGGGAIVFECPHCEQFQMVSGSGGTFCSTDDCLTVLSIRATYKTGMIRGSCHGI